MVGLFNTGVARRMPLGERIYMWGVYIFLGVFSILTLYPFLYVLSASFSSGPAVAAGRVWLYPVDTTLNAYREILAESELWYSYLNSIIYTVLGTAIALSISIGMAYALSKKRLRFRGVLTFILALTLWFNAGLIPSFLNIRALGLYNTRMVIILLGSVSAFNIIILRTFFQSIPSSLEESAFMDGASDLQVLLRIYVPTSIPAIATIGLYYGVAQWNSFFSSLVYLKDLDLIPIQLYLRNLIIDMDAISELNISADAMAEAAYSNETFMYATLVVSIVPVVAVYPFLLKYFVKGVMIGSIKG